MIFQFLYIFPHQVKIHSDERFFSRDISQSLRNCDETQPQILLQLFNVISLYDKYDVKNTIAQVNKRIIVGRVSLKQSPRQDKPVHYLLVSRSILDCFIIIASIYFAEVAEDYRS